MRIIHVLTRLLRAGSEENTIASALWQAQAGHDVTIIHGPDPDPYWQNRYHQELTFIEVAHLVHPIHPIHDVQAVVNLRSLFRKLKPDVIHTHQSKAGIIGRLGATAFTSALVVHGIHIIPFAGVNRLKKIIYRSAEKLAARYTDRFIAVSDSVGQAYVDEGICDQFDTVYSGMDLDPFRSPHLPHDATDLIGVEPHQKDRPNVILMLAAFEERKRHIPFLEAFARQKGTMKPAKIIFAGKGPYEAEVRRAVGRLGLEDQVVFAGYREDPEALIALSDLCLLTSEREGLPRVMVQSLAAGKPVIVTRLPGIEEIVRDGINGLITDAEDLDQTIEAISSVFHAPEQLAVLANGAKQTDVSAWTLEKLGERTTDIYRRELAKLPETRRSPAQSSDMTSAIRP